MKRKRGSKRQRGGKSRIVGDYAFRGTTYVTKVPDSKYFDTEATAFALGEETNGWGANNDVYKGTICLPTQGDTISSRKDNKVSVYKIDIRGVIQQSAQLLDQTAMSTSPAYRLVLWVDKQCSGTVTTSGTLFRTPTATTTGMVMSQFQDPASFGRFKVLRDIVIDPVPFATIDDTADLAAGSVNPATGSLALPDVPFRMTYKFKKPMEVRFKASAGAIGDVLDNAIYFSIQKSNNAAAHTCEALARCYFKDY